MQQTWLECTKFELQKLNLVINGCTAPCSPFFKMILEYYYFILSSILLIQRECDVTQSVIITVRHPVDINNDEAGVIAGEVVMRSKVLRPMILPGYQTSNSASSSKFQHFALLVKLVSFSSIFTTGPCLWC